MVKKITIAVIIIFTIFFGIWTAKKIINNTKTAKEEESNLLVDNNTSSKNLANNYVTDECINEWKDYAKTIEKEIKQVDSNLNDENTKYIIKNENNYIAIYKQLEDKKEVLYKKTNINIDYLTEDDIKLLDKGIEIEGNEELNKFLEDFE